MRWVEHNQDIARTMSPRDEVTPVQILCTRLLRSYIHRSKTYWTLCNGLEGNRESVMPIGKRKAQVQLQQVKPPRVCNHFAKCCHLLASKAVTVLVLRARLSSGHRASTVGLHTYWRRAPQYPDRWVAPRAAAAAPHRLSVTEKRWQSNDELSRVWSILLPPHLQPNCTADNSPETYPAYPAYVRRTAARCPWFSDRFGSFRTPTSASAAPASWSWCRPGSRTRS